MRSHRAPSIALAALLAAPLSAAAQVAVSGRAVAAQVQSTTLVAGVSERVSGTWIGAGAELLLGPVALNVRGVGGSLSPSGATVALERDGGELQVDLAVRPLRWVSLDGGFTYRAFDSPVGFQKWQLPAIGLTIAPRLGDPALRAYIRAAYLPSVSVSGRDTPDLGLWAEGGVRAAPRSAPITLRFYYRFERYDFPASTLARVEQFDRLALEIGLRFGSGPP